MESRNDQLVMDGEEDMMHGGVCSNCGVWKVEQL